MGGTWMTVVYGVAGMREQGGRVTFHPRLARRIKRLAFHLTVQGQLLMVSIDSHEGQVTYLLREGTGLDIGHLAEELKLEPGTPVSRTLDAASG
jgi:alpha,alpha-trehalose phosphorylase